MFGTPGSRSGPGAKSLHINSRPPITRVSCLNGVGLTSHQSITVPWDTLEWDDVGAFNISNPTVLTTPAGYNAVRVMCHTSWANQFNSAGKFERIVQTWNFATTPVTVFLAEYGYPENTDYTELGEYMDTCSFWPTSPGNIIYLQVNNGNPFSTTFSPSNNGPGPAWLHVEWAYVYNAADTQFH